MVWISGMSQGGTTLLMSLLDSHPELLVYPEEPSFQRIAERTGYADAEHVFADFLFGTPNSLHFVKQAGLAADPSSRYSPGVPASATDHIPKALEWSAGKKMIGLEDHPDFPHARFFQSYMARLDERFKATRPGGAQGIMEITFDALETACREIKISKTPRFNAFKIPFSRVEQTGFEWFRKIYPEGKIVFISRDPLSRLQSRYRYNRRDHAEVGLRHRIRLIQSTAGGETTFQRMRNNNSDVLFIEYESLVTRPEEVLSKVYDFIGIEFDQNFNSITKLGFASEIRTNRTGSKAISTASIGAGKQLSLTDRALYAFFRAMPPYFLVTLWGKLRRAAPR
jgi:sulfotransferase family protein